MSPVYCLLFSEVKQTLDELARQRLHRVNTNMVALARAGVMWVDSTPT